MNLMKNNIFFAGAGASGKEPEVYCPFHPPFLSEILLALSPSHEAVLSPRGLWFIKPHCFSCDLVPWPILGPLLWPKDKVKAVLFWKCVSFCRWKNKRREHSFSLVALKKKKTPRSKSKWWTVKSCDGWTSCDHWCFQCFHFNSSVFF